MFKYVFKRLRDNCEMLRYKQIDAPRKENITIRIVSANSANLKVRFIFCKKYINQCLSGKNHSNIKESEAYGKA